MYESLMLDILYYHTMYFIIDENLKNDKRRMMGCFHRRVVSIH